MAEQRMKVRDKKVQKMTKDGLVEENLTEKSSVRVSSRASDVQMGKNGKDDLNFADKSPVKADKRGKKCPLLCTKFQRCTGYDTSRTANSSGEPKTEKPEDGSPGI